MKAIVIDRFGGPEVMKVSDISKPEPKDDEVLVKNMAVGINPVDFKIREGQYPEVKEDKLPFAASPHLFNPGGGFNVPGCRSHPGAHQKTFVHKTA